MNSKPTYARNCNEYSRPSVGTTHNGGGKFYERQQLGLGSYFLSSIVSDLRSLIIYADVHKKYNDLYFRMVCTKFPYSIYYRTDGDTVDVFAVLDDRRDPESTDDFLRRAEP